MSRGGAMPFVIGQWVSGRRFYGRRALLESLDARGSRRLWVAGLRRIGKTSLLKQLEHRAEQATTATLPLFWDLQGVDGLRELGLTFGDALLDAEAHFHRRGLRIEEIEDEDLFASLAKLASALRRAGCELLLLLDEIDELLGLERAVPGMAEGLWRAVDGCEGARVVLASSPRPADLAAVGDGAAGWLGSFEGPAYLGSLEPDEARSLLRQDHLSAGDRPPFDTATVETLRNACGDHPMLLQILAKRCLELGDAAAAVETLAFDRSVEHLFAVDLDLLNAAERELLRSLARGTVASSADPRAHRLLRLGLVRADAGAPAVASSLTLPNRLLAAWLAR